MIAKETVNGDKPYTLQGEAQRIYESIVNDPRLDVPEAVKALADRVKFVGDETEPFYPVPFKCAESQAGLLGYVALFALAIAKDRYGFDQTCEVDVEQSLLNGLGALFTRHEGEWLSGSPKMMAAVKRWDHGKTRELYRQLATNIYKSKDGRWYSLHGNMNPTPLLEMLNVPQHNEKNLTWPQILDMYAKVVGDIDSTTLDNWSNNVYRTPGTVCWEKEEFEALPHVSCYNLSLHECQLTNLFPGESHQGRTVLQPAAAAVLHPAAGDVGVGAFRPDRPATTVGDQSARPGASDRGADDRTGVRGAGGDGDSDLVLDEHGAADHADGRMPGQDERGH